MLALPARGPQVHCPAGSCWHLVRVVGRGRGQTLSLHLRACLNLILTMSFHLEVRQTRSEAAQDRGGSPRAAGRPATRGRHILAAEWPGRCPTPEFQFLSRVSQQQRTQEAGHGADSPQPSFPNSVGSGHVPPAATAVSCNSSWHSPLPSFSRRLAGTWAGQFPWPALVSQGANEGGLHDRPSGSTTPSTWEVVRHSSL